MTEVYVGAGSYHAAQYIPFGDDAHGFPGRADHHGTGALLPGHGIHHALEPVPGRTGEDRADHDRADLLAVGKEFGGAQGLALLAELPQGGDVDPGSPFHLR